MNDIQALLMTSFSYNSQRTQAEAQIINLLTNDPSNFSALALSLINGDQSINQMQIASLLNAAIKEIYSNNNELSQQNKQVIISLFTHINVPLKCRFLLKKSLAIICEKDNKFSQEIHQQILRLLDNQNTILSSIYSFKILLQEMLESSISQNHFIQQWFHDYIEKISIILQSQLNVEQVNIFLDFLQLFEECISSLFQYDKQEFLQFQNIIFQSSEINKLFLSIFNYQNILKIKVIALKVYKHILCRMFISRNKQQQLVFPIYQSFNQFLIYWLTFLKYTPIKEIIVTIAQILCQAITQTEFYHIYQSFYQELLIDQFLYNLTFSQFQLQILQESPFDFVNQELDFDVRKKYENLQYECFNFTCLACQYIDGALSFVSSTAIMLYKFSINDLSQRQFFATTEQEIQFVQKLQDKKIFSQCNTFQKLEISIMIFLAIKQLIPKRVDIQQYLAIIIKQSFQFVLQLNNELIKILFIKFLGENTIYLRAHFGRIVQNQILEQFFQLDWTMTLLYQLLSSVNQIITNDQQLSIIEKNELFQKLILKIQNQILLCQEIKFFNFIEEWVEQYELPQQTIQQLTFNLVARIFEILEWQQQNSNKEIFMNVCWNSIIKIVQKYSNLDCLLCVEKNVSKLYEQLYKEGNFENKNYIISFLILIIKKLQRVSENQIVLLPAFELCLKEQKDSLVELYDLLNHMIYFGREYFLLEYNQYQYFKLAIQSLTSIQNDTQDRCEGALLIQLGIQCLRADIAEANLKNIFEEGYWVINQSNMNTELQSRTTCIFIIAFLTVRQLSEKILGESISAIDNLILSMNYMIGYDAKLFIIYFSNLIISNPKLLLEQGQNIVTILSYQMEQLQEEKQECDLGQDDESDYFCYEDNDEMKKDLISQISKLKSGYISVDEFVTFKQAFSQVKILHPQLIEQFKTSLHYFTLQKLDQMLSVIRAQYDQPRQIIKIKKRKR